MAKVKMEVEVGNSTYAFNWEQAVFTRANRNYDAQAKDALRELERGVSRLKKAIEAGMQPETVDDRPVIEHRNVDSGPIDIQLSENR